MLFAALLIAVVLIAVVSRVATKARPREPIDLAWLGGRDASPQGAAPGETGMEASGPATGGEEGRTVLAADGEPDAGPAEALEPEAAPSSDPASESYDFVMVLSTNDPGHLLVARSALAAAGIPSIAQGESLLDLTGSMRALVPRGYEARARTVLTTLWTPPAEPGSSEEEQA